jgi:hypothetical protein
MGVLFVLKLSVTDTGALFVEGRGRIPIEIDGWRMGTGIVAG